ncbi:MAG: hypothetical protein M3N51_03585, partial [Actinomycetota bacterium]|nr:hypothetical protein [Actinomycetota bacterium]
MSERPAAPPGHLSESSKRFWRATVRQYELERHHLHLLAGALEAWDRAQEARKLLDEEGIVVQDRFGQPKAHPAVRIERDAVAA